MLTTIRLPNHVTDDVINFYANYNLAQVDPQNFSYRLDKAFDTCNYDVITKPHDIIKKSHLFPMGSTSHVPSLNFFNRAVLEIQSPKFFFFSNIADTPRDIWRHCYHINIIHELLHLWWKFRKINSIWHAALISPRFNRTPDPRRPLYQIKFRKGGWSGLWSFLLIG